jgi:hypothetical protein
LSTTQQWLHETNGPPAVALNPPTLPTATPATPTKGDDETTWADDGAQPGQTQNPPQARPAFLTSLPPSPQPGTRITSGTSRDTPAATCSAYPQTHNATQTAPCLSAA